MDHDSSAFTKKSFNDTADKHTEVGGEGLVEEADVEDLVEDAGIKSKRIWCSGPVDRTGILPDTVRIIAFEILPCLYSVQHYTHLPLLQPD